MDYQKIEKYGLITVLCGSLILLLISFSYSIGFMLGGVAALVAFRYLQRLENVSIDNLSTLRKVLRVNKLIRYLIYALAFLVAFLRPNSVSFIACLVGILAFRMWIYVVGGKNYE